MRNYALTGVRDELECRVGCGCGVYEEERRAREGRDLSRKSVGGKAGEEGAVPCERHHGRRGRAVYGERTLYFRFVAMNFSCF